jgi:hypothetical protein
VTKNKTVETMAENQIPLDSFQYITWRPAATCNPGTLSGFNYATYYENVKTVETWLQAFLTSALYAAIGSTPACFTTDERTPAVDKTPLPWSPIA